MAINRDLEDDIQVRRIGRFCSLETHLQNREVAIPQRAPLSPAASKASAGALEFFPVVEVPNLSNALQAMQKENFFVYGAALEDAVDYREMDRADRAVLVLGSEGEGLRSLTRKRCDQLVFIPRRGQEMESLNVNVAAGILLAKFGGLA